MILEVALGSTNKHFWHHRLGWQLSKGDAKKCQQSLGDYLNKWQVNKYQQLCKSKSKNKKNLKKGMRKNGQVSEILKTMGT